MITTRTNMLKAIIDSRLKPLLTHRQVVTPRSPIWWQCLRLYTRKARVGYRYITITTPTSSLGCGGHFHLLCWHLDSLVFVTCARHLKLTCRGMGVAVLWLTLGVVHRILASDVGVAIVQKMDRIVFSLCVFNYACICSYVRHIVDNTCIIYIVKALNTEES